ncbi:MAG: DEAD/DEAH box helicase, partial [Alphaproteobacteria bacterium]|nr:DEAD/DEAH box helicase [Alphaproteobacteria bacterium]
MEFPFEETVDQLKAIEAIKADMEINKPMDRLICGDVGFGKTEVAMRAAFKCVLASRQCILLCPTTILSQQHYHTLVERFKHFPVNIEVLNRFKSPKQQKLIIEKAKTGEVDILIGNHRLLSKDIQLSNLGLLVIYEEQKFGVKHKEKIREMAELIDTLTLTATPIPRTLHMSLVNIRAISVINTPPMNRKPVQTFVVEFDEDIIVEAMQRELDRGGQAFFLHNRVETITYMANFLRDLLPDIQIGIAHGKMDESELENVMKEFIAKKYDLLLATTIIDSGLDIPNANTIFINQVEHFGLSQLYQLRGRVGRSAKQGYAYMFHQRDKSLSEAAMKRLHSISEYIDLGSGFKIAMKDLEIRGAGNLLGKEQSGSILAVGFDMYCQLLNEAIDELGDKPKIKSKNTIIDIKYNGYIPDSYIPDNKEKIEIYKKIAAISDIGSFQLVRQELM